MIPPILDDRGVEQLRTALAGYTVDAVSDRLGAGGRAAMQRADIRGLVRNLFTGDRLDTLIALFLAGVDRPDTAVAEALDPLPLAAAEAAGIVERAGDRVRAVVDVRPYAEDSPDGAAPAWWVVSDFGSDVRPGPLSPDHVLGVGGASVTLARSTPRAPVGRALDVGTGCGVQALHLGRHSGSVVASDVSERALRMAATTAALSGQAWELRRGSLLEPVAGERFDLVVANPPFVVSSGAVGHEYRDGGLAGDGISAALVRGLPGVLAHGGVGQLLANWVHSADVDWAERLHGWLRGSGCDAWVWQREVLDPAEYVSLWLRDAGEVPGSVRWNERYDTWLDWFDEFRVIGVGMGLVTLWRTDADDPVVVCEDVPQAVDQPIAAHLAAWVERQRWLRATRDADLLGAPVRRVDGIALDRSAVPGDNGWDDVAAELRQTAGMRWAVEIDAPIAALVAGCDGVLPIGHLLAVLAASLGRPTDEVASAALPVVRDLISRGFLLPEVTP